jgi:hypothetical protein
LSEIILTPVPGNPTTFGARIGNTDIEVGDILAPNCRPHLKMKRWGLAKVDLSFYMDVTPSGLMTYDGQTGELTIPIDSNTELKYSVKDPDDMNTEGSVEADLVLKKKPPGNNNQFKMKLESDDLTWKKILPLTEEFDQAQCQAEWNEDGGRQGTYTITPTQIIHDGTGEIVKNRDERLVNSLRGKAKVLYKATSDLGEIKKGLNKGKQLQYTRVSRTHASILRGKAIDADGVEAWVEDMNLVGNDLTFTLPLDFIKNAKYPIRQAVGADPAYTEDLDQLDFSGMSDATWNEYDIETNEGLTSGLVAEIMLENQQKGTQNQIGVRTYGSTKTPTYDMDECEPDGGGGGDSHGRMFVEVGDNSGTGYIEVYTEDVSDLAAYLLGYWSNTSWTEVDEQGYANNSNDTWIDIDTITNINALNANTVYLIAAYIIEEVAITIGVRAGGSALDRKLLGHEAEAAGYVENILTFFAKTDANGDIEVFDGSEGSANDKGYHVVGYFGSEVDFNELWQVITNDGDSDWDAEDLTAYLDQDGRVCDFLLGHHVIDSPHTLGVSDGDDPTPVRYFVEHEAEDNGTTTGEVTGFGISVKSNASGVVKLYSSTADEDFYLMGYFKPSAAGPGIYDESVTDGLKTSDTLASQAIFDVIITDGFKGSESMAGVGTFPKSITDGVKLSESLIGNLLLSLIATDGVKLSDTVLTQMVLAALAGDGVKMSDTPLSQLIAEQVATDGVKMSDVPLSNVIFQNALTDGVELSDTTIAGILYNLSLTDGVKMSEALSLFLTLNLLASDGVKLSDSLDTLLTSYPTASDGLVLSDSPLANIIALLTLADGIKLSDVTQGNFFVDELVTDGVELSESLAAQLESYPSLTDGVKVSDVVLAILTATLLITDGVKLSDVTTIIKTIEELVSDGIKLSEALEAIRTVNVDLTDGVKVSDIASAVVILNLLVQDGIKLSDVVDWGGQAYNMLISDGVKMSDTITRAIQIVAAIKRVSQLHNLMKVSKVHDSTRIQQKYTLGDGKQKETITRAGDEDELE